MGTLQEEFLGDAILQLDKLIGELGVSAEMEIGQPLLIESFRRIHSIKGTSHVFGLKIPADFAHSLESLLHDIRDRKIVQPEGFTTFLSEGLRHLKAMLIDLKDGKKPVVPHQYLAMLRSLTIESVEIKNQINNELPRSLLSGLTQDEITVINNDIGSGLHFFLIEVFLDPSELARIGELRTLLSDHGRVAAVSSADPDAGDRLGFRFYFTGKTDELFLKEIISGFNAQIVFPGAPAQVTYSAGLKGAVSQIVSSGKNTAVSKGKEIEFEVNIPELPIEGPQLKSIYEILLHLVRNAVDHAIETPAERLAAGKRPEGTISITITNSSDWLEIEFADDGRGIDEQKIREKAQIEGVHQAELLELIFTHGFTTREAVSDYSGRGVGLDIVKQLIDKENGSVSLSTALGKGTTFSIKLPNPAVS